MTRAKIDFNGLINFQLFFWRFVNIYIFFLFKGMLSGSRQQFIRVLNLKEKRNEATWDLI
jgi:hypothetical protein